VSRTGTCPSCSGILNVPCKSRGLLDAVATYIQLGRLKYIGPARWCCCHSLGNEDIRRSMQGPHQIVSASYQGWKDVRRSSRRSHQTANTSLSLSFSACMTPLIPMNEHRSMVSTRVGTAKHYLELRKASGIVRKA